MRKVGIVLAVIMGSGFVLIVGGFFTLLLGSQFVRVSPSTSTAYLQPAIGPAITPTTVAPASYPGSTSPYAPYSTQAGYSSPGSVPVAGTPFYNSAPQPLQPAYPSISSPASAEKSQLEQRYVELSRQHATEMNEAELKHKVAQLEAKVRIKRAMTLLGAVEQEMSFLEEKFEATRLAAEATAIKQPLNKLKAQLTEMASLPEQVKQPQDAEAATPATEYGSSLGSYPRTATTSYPVPADASSTDTIPPADVTNNPRFQFPAGAPTPIGALIIYDENTSSQPTAVEPYTVPAATPHKASSGRVLTVTPGANLIGEEEEPLLGLEAEPETKPTKEAKPVTAAKTKRETTSIITVTPRIIIQEEEEENLGLTTE